ncbi:MAG TPA: gamma carbonic anhydrase family protein [Stellaceae bacterium]|nr:gamma carbonic anhydrase family protein [Stellaceae bacterium]
MSHPLLLPFRDKRPRIALEAWVAANAVLVGDVDLAAGANIWFGCVLRADIAPITVGTDTNIQDGTVVHVSGQLAAGTRIGAGVTIGHMALIHACTLEDRCFIGMKACVMDGAVVETGAWVAAGAVVTPGKRVLAGQLWAGTPARYLRDLKPDEKSYIETLAPHYVKLARAYHPALVRT